MIPWNKLTDDLQKAILAMVVVLGGASASCRLLPIVCDPPPPPSLTPMLCDPPPPPPSSTPSTTPAPGDSSQPSLPIPTFSRTPIVCDPPPPPNRTPTSTRTPMIFDPPPLPSNTPTLTRTPMVCDPPPPPAETITPMICDPAPPPTIVVPTAHFMLRSAQQSSDPDVYYAEVRGTVLDSTRDALAGVSVTVSAGDWSDEVNTSRDGTFSFVLPLSAGCVVVVGGDEDNAVQLPLNRNDVITLEWVQVMQESRQPLPLAEVRTVSVAHVGGLSFAAQTPYPGAHFDWTVTGGSIVGDGERVTWQPPEQPGRYLLQVIADWGASGLAAGAVVLEVDDDGSEVLC